MKRPYLSGLLAAISAICASSWANAQDYKQDEPLAQFYTDPATTPDAKQRKEKEDAARQQLRAIGDLLKDGVALNPDRERTLRAWFEQYYFPMMTLATEEGLKKMPDYRKVFLKDMDRSNTEVPAVHDFVRDLAFEYFKRVAVEEYHPAVRYNAILILGSLNLNEKVSSGGGTPPVPHAGAYTFMLDQYSNKDQVDAVRLGALIGVSRHVQLDAQDVGRDARFKIPAAELDRTRQTMVDLVNTPQPPAGRSLAGHHWMRRRAIEILSWIGAGKIDQPIFDLLLARLSDHEEDRGVRCECAIGMGRILYVPDPARPQIGATAIDAKPREVAAELARFVVQGYEADVKAVNYYIKSIEEADEIYSGAGGAGSGMQGSGRAVRRPRSGKGAPGNFGAMMPAGGAMGATGGSGVVDPFGFRIEPVYRKLRHEIGCAMRGLRGSEEWNARPASAGIAMLVPAMTADLGEPKNAALKKHADREYFEKIGQSLKSLSTALRVKDSELDTYVFEKENREKVEVLSKLVLAAIPQKPKAPVNKAAPAEIPVDPLEEPEIEAAPAKAADADARKAKLAPAKQAEPAPEPEPEP